MARDLHSILVVEDDPATRYATARGLRWGGYKIMEATSGAEALEFAEYVSAIVLDVHLPDLIGWEVCRLLRSKPATADLPIIHLTARYTTSTDRIQSRECGADAFFVHPADPEELLRTIDELIAAVPVR